MQNHNPPSFFLTNTTVLHHALWLSQIVPGSSISQRWFWTSSTRGRGICLNHSLKGLSLVTLIECSIEWVQPNSAGSIEKTLWYSAKSWQVASANSGDHESNPRRSSSSNNFPCLCLTVSLGVWGSWSLSFPSHKWVSTGGPITVVKNTTLATGVFFWRFWGLVVLFLTTMTAFLLPCFNSMYIFCMVRPWEKRAISSHNAWVMTLMHSLEVSPLHPHLHNAGGETSIVSAFWMMTTSS